MLEHLGLSLSTVVAYTPTAHLHTVADQVVGLGPHLPRFALQQWDVLRVCRSEWMVDGVPSPLVATPRQQREVCDEGVGQDVRVRQAQTPSHLVTQGREDKLHLLPWTSAEQ